ncbi:hypothetical protein Sros01_83620 [Streptomyces roseochromogenus]|nr:hypothetical protein Sros01_83620 [Streptomyces roseochromogenus]
MVEECGQYDECGRYATAFGDNMIVIEYTDRGMKKACQGWGNKVSIVHRDLRLVSDGAKDYHDEVCARS